jgi:hypothetical protein
MRDEQMKLNEWEGKIASNPIYILLKYWPEMDLLIDFRCIYPLPTVPMSVSKCH